MFNFFFQYVTKPENKSNSFQEMISEIVRDTNEEEASVRKVLSRVMMKLVKQHDMCKNEAWKVASGEEFVEFSRPFVSVNVTQKRRIALERYHHGDPEGDALTKNHADTYWTRDEEAAYQEACETYEKDTSSYPRHPKLMSLYDFATYCDKKWHSTRVIHVPLPSPQYHYVPDRRKPDGNYEKYCQTQLLLFKPGSNPVNVLWKDYDDESAGLFTSHHEALWDFVTDSSSSASIVLRDEVKLAQTLYEKRMADPSLSNNTRQMGNAEEDCEDGAIDHSPLVPSPLANLEVDGEEIMPGLTIGGEVMDAAGAAEEIENMLIAMHDERLDEDLTELVHNQEHNWHEDRIQLGLTDDDIKRASGWIREQQNTFDLPQENESSLIDLATLNEGQRLVFDRCMTAMNMATGDVGNPQGANDNSATASEQMLIDVSGGAGTGKSYLIRAIIQHGRNQHGPRAVKILSPTGAAATQFSGGQTIHKGLHISICRKRNSGLHDQQQVSELSDDSAARLQQELQDLRLLIIDEKSMMGLGMLRKIDVRLKEARPNMGDVPFGGVSIMLAGDLNQLPPIGDTPLYQTARSLKRNVFTEHSAVGFALYRLFDKYTYILDEQMRQRGAENARFKEELNRLADNTFTAADYERWRDTMGPQRLSTESPEQYARRIEEFETSGTKLAGEKKQLVGFNQKKIQELGNPICQSLALNNPPSAAETDANDADRLVNQLHFAKDCKVLLTQNYWTEANLVNGSMGRIRYIIYSADSDPKVAPMPALLLVHFPNYIGPSFLEDEECIVPVVPHFSTWRNRAGVSMSRTQFPLIYGYAITIHKGQGEQSL